MTRPALYAICLLQIATAVYGLGKYSVIGPGTLHSGGKYTVAVGVHETQEPTQIKVGIVGPDYNEVKMIDLQPNEVKSIDFDVPIIKEGTYNLTAEGVSGIVFKNTTKLNYNDFEQIIKIQTDKGVYKPGDELNFRVLFMDENLKPAVPKKKVVIYFEDAKSNRIKEIKNIEVVKGVYTGKFQISDFPVLGSWRLSVETEGKHWPETVYFEVDKYVLPKFTVRTEPTTSVAVQDGDMQVVVRANYTFDKPFNGKVTLVATLGSYYYSDDKESSPPTLIKKADMVNGKAKFDLDVRQYEEYMKQKRNSYYMSITVTVEENFTGVKINDTASSTLYPYRYSMRCINYDACHIFRHDEEFEVPIEVSRVDSIQLKDTKSVLKLTYTENIQKHFIYRDPSDKTPEPPMPQIENKTFTFESRMNASNIAVFKVKLPELAEFEGYEHYYQLKAIYADEDHEIYRAYQYRKPKELPQVEQPAEPKDYFKLHLFYKNRPYNYYYRAEADTNDNMSDDVTVTVNSSTPISYFVYNVVGRGNVLSTERVVLSTPTKVHNFTITPTFLMRPNAHVYVYYVDVDGELHYAESSFYGTTELQNQINITMPEKVKPSEEVSLKIKTAPNSFVGLLAVDQSVLLLRANNDIMPADFQWQIGRYSTYTPSQGGYSRYPGEYTGVVTLTNANYFYNWTNPYPDHGLVSYSQSTRISGMGGGMGAARPAAAAPAQDSDVEASLKGGAGGGAPGPADIAVRKNFAETWIFDNIENTSGEEFIWKKQIPDTITSWVLNAFSLSPEKGLGVLHEKSKIITFQPFFVVTRLPYSVKRGEVLNLPVLVFNYLDKNLDVEITLDNTDGEFEFTEATNEIINEKKRIRTINVPSQSSAGASFMIRPKILGNIMLKLTAISPIAGDAIHKSLKVVPEGSTVYANRAYFVNLKDTHDLTDTFEVALPEDVVPDSQHVEFAVVGDLLGPVINKLGNLVRMPGGCAEQTMSSTLFNYIVLKYLKSTEKLTSDMEEKLIRNLEGGYQRILNYKNQDGSFSIFSPWGRLFDERPSEGSTWLTAYIARSLGQLREFITIDKKILQESLQFLVSRQADNGSFVENGTIFSYSLKNDISLTTSVLLAFHENKDLAESHQKIIDQGFKYLVEHWKTTSSLHDKAFATFLLHKAKHPIVPDFLANLKGLAKTEDDRMWWSERDVKSSPSWWQWVYSSDVETTSYILFTLLDTATETVDSVLPIVRWLIAQRNSYGGFGSTQDTVAGLQALTKFVEKSGYEPAIMSIDYSSKGGKPKQDTVTVNEDNGLVLQIEELPQSTNAIEFHAKGKGTALVQISYQYNIFEKEAKPSFDIKTVINKDTPKLKLEMNICVEYQDGVASNMAVMEVSLPSGYTVDADSFDQILEVDRVKLTETKNSDTVLVIYFDSLRKGDPVCLPIEAFKTHTVVSLVKSTIVLYDYYDTTKKAAAYYNIDSKFCDICEGDAECEKACT